MSRERLQVLSWQVHGNYLYYLSQVPVQWWVVTRPGNPPGYSALGSGLPWGDNIREIPFDAVREQRFDCVLYQSRAHWEQDRQTLLSAAQRELPTLYLEHDPPQQHPSNTVHWAQDADLLVHVTPFNALMWDSGAVATRVIDHTAVLPADIRYQGEDPRGIVVVNHLLRRGRRLGADLYLHAQRQVPLALAGMDAARVPGGIGEIAQAALPALMARHRYFFHPVRWTSLGLALIEAMAVGLPIVGVAATELPSIIENGRNGWIDTDPQALIEVMQRLAREPQTARRWGEAARETMQARFATPRFVDDWLRAFAQAINGRASSRASAA